MESICPNCDVCVRLMHVDDPPEYKVQRATPFRLVIAGINVLPDRPVVVVCYSCRVLFMVPPEDFNEGINRDAWYPGVGECDEDDED